MKRAFAAFAAAAFVVTLTAAPFAAEKTVKGELIDVQCHTKKATNVGEAHKDCATSCAKKGAPMGIHASDGVYTITGDLTKENNKELVPHVGHTVEVTGEVTEKDGKKTIAATSLKMAKAEKTQ